ncbi:hypothetical protein M878_09325 [Streptomyces roseochromogenus subsp. oscitans DS 12.976]|uniref:DUF2264 domain-containing protein n=1 Tax=Streptomyces roseochromogenus subsp. oscitans DS 12.976 TaxID=1352936 RepID=V6KTA3_STRRC|nr:DUF2264 domain-containing protein [Streptomyces roseochromogenus]EST34646.1 hypothetical protein M878_09325 [Streptomyces roseochromogenus subsp. oscitans DS 12.976]
MIELPAEDRALSPYTGYSRTHWEVAADALLAAVEPYATPDRALYHLPGDHVSQSGHLSDGLEGYARTLLLAAFRRDETALDRYADGLATGPGGVWPRIGHRGQPLVEAASVALALRLTRPLLWDRLDDSVRQRTADWLADALTAEPWPCNWELFPVTVGGFLAEIGHRPEAARKAIDRGLERIEGWYLGDGWYTDGDGRKFDYYNGWAMHLYTVVHAWLADDSELLSVYGRRLSCHLADYARLFGGDGAPLHQGRSLTYRFATAAPLWLGALIGQTPLAPGETRRLASGALRYFLDGGAVDERGLLPLGWLGPDESLVQNYSGPASPYWASKGFLGLLLPPEHQVWTATEEPGPADRADEVRPVAVPNWLLQSTRSDGLVRLHNHGSDDVRYDPYYTRLAYSTATTPHPVSYDNSVIVGGDPSRTGIEPLGTGAGWIASRHTVRDGITVTSLVVAEGAVEVRAHLVAGAAPGTPVRITGWAAPDGALRAELLPVSGLSEGLESLEGLTGETGAGGATLFVALARLTGEPDPRPLRDLVSVRVTVDDIDHGAREVSVRWVSGAEGVFRFTASDGRSGGSSWSVTPR